MALKKLFSTQSLWDEEIVRIGRTLKSLQTALIGVLIVALIVVLAMGRLASALGLLVGLIAVLATSWLNRSGQVLLASFLCSLAMLGTLTYLLYVGQGIHDIAMMGLPLLLIFASLLLSRRLYWIIASFTVLASLLVIFGEVRGFHTTPYSVATTYSDMITVAAMLILAAYTVDLLAQSQQESLGRIRQVAAGQAKLIEETRRRAEHLATLNRVGIAIASGLDLQRVLMALYLQMRDVIHADTYYIALYDSRTGLLTFPIFYDLGERVPMEPTFMQDEPGLTGEVIIKKRTLYLPDAEDPTTQAAHQVITVGPSLTRTFLGIPIILRDQVLGVLSVQSLHADAYTTDQISLLETMATQAAVAIQNARLYATLQEELIERRRVESVLNQRDVIMQAVSFAAQKFMTALDWSECIPEVLERLGKSTGFAHAYIYENNLDMEGQWLTSLRYEWIAVGYRRPIDDSEFQDIPLTVFRFERWRTTMEQRQTSFGSLSSLPPEEAERLAANDLKTYLDVPIFTSDGWWGFLGFDDSREEREWSKVEVGALETAANILSAAIQRQKADDERKEAESAVRQLNAELEQRVSQRTAELTVANRELESFAYSVAHDLRAPLRGIDGYSKLLLEDYAKDLDAEGALYLENIRTGAQWMGQLIDDLLRLSRITRLEMHNIQVSLTSLAHEALETLRHNDPVREVEVVVQQDMKVSGDPGLLGLAIENLLRNAWKFTSKKPYAHIEVGMSEMQGRTVYFVRDNGAGFDMKYADKLFRPFQRLHSEGDFEGTGVGLATVQRIIQRHGGEIWAEAETGGGATFYFTLAASPLSGPGDGSVVATEAATPQPGG
jgi:signal transduction histidine kinase